MNAPNHSNDTVALLQSISKLEPSFQGYEPKEMELDRVTAVATVQLKNCDGLDLLTSVWRGRIISATKTILEQRNANSVYVAWLKEVGLTEVKAMKLIETAIAADKLLFEEKLTLNGIANIALKAFEIVSSNAPALTVVAELAEGGAEVTADTAKRLLEEQTVAQTETLDDSVKEKALVGMLPISKTAKLVSELEKLEESDREEISGVIETDCSIDNLNHCLEQSKALNKFLDSVPLVENFKGEIEQDELLSEAQAREIVPLVAQISGLIRELETLATKVHIKKEKLMNLCDRLFAESSSADHNLRVIANKFGYEFKELIVPLDGEAKREVRLTTEIIEAEPEN